jgi:hypothetical protein
MNLLRHRDEVVVSLGALGNANAVCRGLLCPHVDHRAAMCQIMFSYVMKKLLTG